MKVVVALLAFLAVAHYASAVAMGRADIIALSPTEVNLGAENDNYVIFEAINDTHVRVTVHITGITNNPDSMHGMHIHQYGDISSGASLGGHWDPHGVAHGCPQVERSAGDLGNWQAVAGTIDDFKELDLIDLYGPFSVIGRGVVLHNNTDDCATVPSSGSRLAAGVIGVANAVGNEAAADGLTAPYLAVCNLFPTTSGVGAGQGGWFSWSQTTTGAEVSAIGELSRLGVYGVHVHAYGDLSARDSGVNTGGHFDPLGTAHHDLPNGTDPHHAGDMGNTDVTLQIAGSQWFSESFNYMTIAQTANNESIIGRGFIVHADLDQGASQQPTGAAGARHAQCVIGIASSSLTLVPTSLPSPDGSSPSATPSSSPSSTPSSGTPMAAPTPSGDASSLLPAVGLIAISVLALLF